MCTTNVKPDADIMKFAYRNYRSIIDYKKMRREEDYPPPHNTHTHRDLGELKFHDFVTHPFLDRCLYAYDSGRFINKQG